MLRDHQGPKHDDDGQMAPREPANPAQQQPSHQQFSNDGPLPAVAHSEEQPAPDKELPTASQLAYGEEELGGEIRDGQTQDEAMQVRASHLRVRTAPSLQGEVVGSLPYGTHVEAHGRDGEWLRVSFNGTQAFINSRYVEPDHRAPGNADAVPAEEKAPALAHAHPAASAQKAAAESTTAQPVTADTSLAEIGEDIGKAVGAALGGWLFGESATQTATAQTATAQTSTAQPAAQTATAQTATAQAATAQTATTQTAATTATTLKGTALPGTTKEEATVLNEIRNGEKRFDPAWLLEAQRSLGVANATGAFNTETLRKMRERKNDNHAKATALLDVTFLESIYSDSNVKPFADDKDLLNSTFEKNALGSRSGNGADRTAQQLGYRNWQAYADDNFVDIEFLGKTLPGRGHAYLAARLKLAEEFLKQLNPGKEGKALRDAVGWNGAGNASYDTDKTARDAGKTHVHTMGMAIDIDKEQNPWMLGLHINDDTKANHWWIYDFWQPVFEIASNVYGGDPISIANMNTWSEELSTEEMHAKVMQSSDAFVQLLALCRSGDEKAVEQALVNSGKYNAHEAKEKYDSLLGKVPGYWSQHGREKFGRTENTKSFTNQSQQLVVALRDVAGLAWGGSELASTENGDFMHFDCRHLPYGKTVYDAGYANRGRRS